MQNLKLRFLGCFSKELYKYLFNLFSNCVPQSHQGSKKVSEELPGAWREVLYPPSFTLCQNSSTLLSVLYIGL